MASRRSDRRTERGPLHRLPEALRAHERAPGRARDDGRGRTAETPQQIPARGWKDVAMRVKEEVKTDNIGLVGAGVAFYALLALFPSLVALISLYGLVVEPAQASRQVEEMLSFIPESSRAIIETQLENITNSPKAGLGIGLAVAVLGALWSASGGMRALMTGLNVAYDEQESRKFIKLRLASLALTLGAVIFAAAALGGIVGVPAAFDAGEPIGLALAWLRWPALALLMMVGLSAIYRFGPDRDDPKWSWVSWGAGIATLLWVAMSAIFSFYVSSFGKFNKTYGALAGVVVLMLWLSLSAFIVLLGAEINAELERQTVVDTTRGRERPLGSRDAYAADTVGETAEEVKDRKQGHDPTVRRPDPPT
jgi:membrane protein